MGETEHNTPIVISADGILTNNIHRVIIANKDVLVQAFSSAEPNTFAAVLSIKGVISKQDEAQISLASTPSEKATILVTAVEHQIKRSPEKFQDFLKVILSLPEDIVETLKLWSDYYDKTPAFSDPNKIAAVLSNKGVISTIDETQISLASTQNEKVTTLVNSIEHQINTSPKKFEEFINALQEASLSVPNHIVERLWPPYNEAILTFLSADPITIVAKLSVMLRE